MTDDLAHDIMHEQWDEPEYSHEEYMMTPRWCTDEDCIFPDPNHSPDECYTAEMAEEYLKEGMRTSEEYKLALNDVLKKVNGMGGNDLRRYLAKTQGAANGQTFIGFRLAIKIVEDWLTKQLDNAT